MATEANLLNHYGVPDYKSFASYGYAVAMHTDNDDTATMGWVSARSEQVNEILFMNNMPINCTSRCWMMRAILCMLNSRSF